MKDLITSILLIIALLTGGGMALKSLHNTIREAALEKASQGLPSLTELHRSLKAEPKERR